MIDVHYWPTPNGWKVTIMLEECGLPHRVVPVVLPCIRKTLCLRRATERFLATL